MTWKIIEIWRDHTYSRGKHKGEEHRAYPKWSDERGGYDTYPSDSADNSNILADSETAKSLAELYDHLGRGRGVRCIIPTTGDTPILGGHFKAIFAQD